MLFGTRGAHQVVVAYPELHAAAALAQSRLDTMPWAVYDVRRIFHARGGDADRKGHAWRSVRRLHTGDHANRDGVPVVIDEHNIPRAWYQHAGEQYPTVERYLTTAPAVVADKERSASPASGCSSPQPDRPHPDPDTRRPAVTPKGETPPKGRPGKSAGRLQPTPTAPQGRRRSDRAVSLPTSVVSTHRGDLVGLHPDNTARVDPNPTYLIVGPASPDGTLPIWRADRSQPGALDWAAVIHPADIRYLIRATSTGVTTWHCHCCHPHPTTSAPET